MGSQPPSSQPIWPSERLANPHADAQKRSRVQAMFTAIAPRYDLNNRLHSFGMDQRWRRRAVKLARVQSHDRIVDVACGTGDLTQAFRDRLTEIGPTRRSAVAADAQVIGIDFTFDMLPIAQRKSAFVLNGPLYANGDATALPLDDACADVVSIAFGIRNVQEPAKALAEFFRVLRPGGRVIILEFSQPRNRLIRWANDVYCSRIMPHTATWLSGDKTGAYRYLPKSVETFMSREQMMAMMRDAGFVEVTQHPMTFGVCVGYRGYKR